MQRRRSLSKKDAVGTFLPYDVVYCTSEDPQHPIREMAGCTVESMKLEDSAGGWESAANGKVPQTVVLRFPGNVFLQQIKLLSHEAKIPSRVEVRVFALKEDELQSPPSYRAARFTKLGAVEFNSNEHTGFRSKERKTVHLEAQAYYLKLLFDRPYVNDLNMKQQIGIYSIECSGRLLSPVGDAPVPSTTEASSSRTSAMNSQLHSARGERLPDPVRVPQATPPSNSAAPPALSLPPLRPADEVPTKSTAWTRQSNVQSSIAPQPPPTTIARDEFCASQESVFRSIRIQQFEEFFIHRTEELLLLKEQAITVEDFDTARVCRDKLNTMNVRSKRIYQLEQEKVQAIIEEDFETAETARDAMNQLVDAVYRDTQLPVPRPDFDADGEYNRVPAPTAQNPPGRHRDTEAEKDSVRLSVISPDQYSDRVEEAPLVAPSPVERRAGPATAMPTGASNVDVEILPKLEPLTSIPMNELASTERELAETILSVATESSDAVTPVSMPGADARLVSSIGNFTALCLFSTKFKLREAAIIVLTEKLDVFFPTTIAPVEEAVLRFLDVNGYGLQDNIPNVVAASCTFVRMTLADQYNVIGAVVPQLVALIPRLLTRAADAQARVRDEAVTTLTLLVRTAAIPSSALLAAALAEPIDRERRTLPSTNAKAQVARLNFMQSIVENGRLAVENPRAIMSKLLIPGMNHQNAEVRDLATNILSSLILAKTLIPTESELKKINNPAIRDLLQGRRQSVV